ncbi:unnamed protein product [Sphagnum jensenii]|uniref:Uncharacterized protein n=1 Tax=Sphagnum jensenii TaxID=128206 RepID=A0ABP1ABW9_9BRYO
MGSLPEMGGPMIGKQYCLPCATRYKIKHSGGKVAFENKWDICDENGVVIFQAIKERPNANAPNSSWSFKYETRVQDVEGKLVTRFKFKEKGNLKVFRNFDLKEMDPNYKTHKHNYLGCKPLDYVILHGTEPLAEVLKNDSWFHLNEYIVAMHEGANVVLVALLILMMDDMESMFAAINATSFSFFNYNYRSAWPF